MEIQRRKAYYRLANGEKRKIKKIVIRQNGKDYKFIGIKERDDGKNEYIFSPDENDPREANQEEIYQFYHHNGYDPIIRFL